ncbi:MAG: cytosine permease [Rhodospirillaceae bacterium]|nr:cytosine permease [Rhodospirillaceae bacterium]MDD9999720.1 cytosine permease [Rhodospirillaceae bacterium]MDE0363844.1 cytosine permease [Rhodospirillaceae bacterium]
MDSESLEFATEPVPPEHRVGWIRVGVISAMVAFSLPTFVTGAEVFLAIDNANGMAAVLVGCALITLIGSVAGLIGTRTHLSSYMLARIAFGTNGAAIVNIAFAISLLGWFGVNIDLFGGALLRLLEDTLGLSVHPWVIELFAGALMTVTTIYGFRAINALSTLLVPVMMVVTVVLISSALGSRPFAETLGAQQVAEITFGYAVSSVIGGIIVGAVILPDITRFIRKRRGAIYTAVLAYLVVQPVVMVAGGLAADLLANDDFLDVLIVMGLSWAAFVIVIAGSWVLNSLNLYSTTLSIEATFPKSENRLLIIILGALGTVAAFFNILDYFLAFLFYLAIVFVPVAGVIAVDHFLARPSAYFENLHSAERSLSPMALVAWAAGSIVALLGAEEVIRLTGVAAVDAMLVSAAGYALLSRFDTSLPRSRAA